MSNSINGAHLNKITPKRTVVSSQRIVADIDLHKKNIMVAGPHE